VNLTSQSPAEPLPDPRWVDVVAGVDDQGRVRPMSYAALASVPDQWATTESTPTGVADLLHTTRATFALSWFHYELLVVSVAWSLLAVEAALRDRLSADDKSPLKALLTLAGKHLLLSPEDIDRLEAGRVLRNRLTHARNQQAWSVGLAAPVVAASHHAVTLIYPDPI